MNLEIFHSKFLNDDHFELLTRMEISQPIVLSMLRNKLLVKINSYTHLTTKEDINKWVMNNCKGFCYNPNNAQLYYFENDDDMLQFKLVWHGHVLV